MHGVHDCNSFLWLYNQLKGMLWFYSYIVQIWSSVSFYIPLICYLIHPRSFYSNLNPQIHTITNRWPASRLLSGCKTLLTTMAMPPPLIIMRCPQLVFLYLQLNSCLVYRPVRLRITWLRREPKTSSHQRKVTWRLDYVVSLNIVMSCSAATMQPVRIGDVKSCDHVIIAMKSLSLSW